MAIASDAVACVRLTQAPPAKRSLPLSIGKALVGPFKDVFKNKRPKVSIALNWGLAALVYLIVGAIIASILRRLAFRSHPDRVA